MGIIAINRSESASGITVGCSTSGCSNRLPHWFVSAKGWYLTLCDECFSELQTLRKAYPPYIIRGGDIISSVTLKLVIPGGLVTEKQIEAICEALNKLEEG